MLKKLFLILSLLIICKGVSADMAKSTIDTTIMDLSVKPGDDFYRYANGKWLDSTEIPQGVPRFNTFSYMQQNVANAILEIMESAASDTTGQDGSIKQKIGDFYASGMDTLKIETDGITPLNKELELIENIANFADLQKVVARFQLYGFNPIFKIHDPPNSELRGKYEIFFRQAGIGLPDAGYYLNENEASQKIREEYLQHISQMLQLLDDESDISMENAQRILKIETQLAERFNSDWEYKKLYNKTKIKKLSKMIAAFDWEIYFRDIGIITPKHVILGQPEFFKRIGEMLNSVNLDDWKLYLRWNLIHNTAKYLNSDFVSEHYRFYNGILSNYSKPIPRKERVSYAVEMAMPDAVGKLYTKKYFTPEIEQKAWEMINNIKLAYRERIQNLEWMNDSEKQRSLEKLEAMTFKIGGPDKIPDYSKLEISRESYLQNFLNARKFTTQQQLAQFGKPIDTTKWLALPQSLEGWYSVVSNEVTYVASNFQPPLFIAGGDDAFNYGSLGTFIAHEITHGFDNQGKNFDKDGKSLPFWKKGSSKQFNKHAEGMINQYNNYIAIDDHHVNGKGTLMENIADFGGVAIAFDAFKLMLDEKSKSEKIKGFTPEQRFFIAYTQKWKEKIDNDHLIQTLNGFHAPARYRAIGPLFNIPEFYQTFDIEPDNKLYIKEENRVKIW